MVLGIYPEYFVQIRSKCPLPDLERTYSTRGCAYSPNFTVHVESTVVYFKYNHKVTVTACIRCTTITCNSTGYHASHWSDHWWGVLFRCNRIHREAKLCHTAIRAGCSLCTTHPRQSPTRALDTSAIGTVLVAHITVKVPIVTQKWQGNTHHVGPEHLSRTWTFAEKSANILFHLDVKLHWLPWVARMDSPLENECQDRTSLFHTVIQPVPSLLLSNLLNSLFLAMRCSGPQHYTQRITHGRREEKDANNNQHDGVSQQTPTHREPQHITHNTQHTSCTLYNQTTPDLHILEDIRHAVNHRETFIRAFPMCEVPESSLTSSHLPWQLKAGTPIIGACTVIHNALICMSWSGAVMQSPHFKDWYVCTQPQR